MSRPEINVIIELDNKEVSSVNVTPPLPGSGEMVVEGHEQLQGLEVVARVVFGISVVVNTG